MQSLVIIIMLAQPAEPGVAPAEPVAPDAAQILANADALLDAGRLEEAKRLYGDVLLAPPGEQAHAAARRALRLIELLRVPAAEPAQRLERPRADVRYLLEPYSQRTSERLRVTTWEKIDFSETPFLYGKSVGFSYGIGAGDTDSVGPMVLGAIAYTLLAVGYLTTADPDRGDLPLSLAVMSYVPTAVLLGANLLTDDLDERATSLAVALSASVAAPVSLLLSRHLDLDPGDTQLVRDSGFWGMLVAMGLSLGWGGDGPYEGPSGDELAAMGLVGLGSGLVVGGIAASSSEVSLERVRMTTWGGYGGAVLGAMIGATASSEESAFRITTVGALLGLTVTFLASKNVDAIPEDAEVLSDATPTMTPLPNAKGGTDWTLGLHWSW